MQILIVSQVAPVRHTLRVPLENQGHKVLVAETLEGAVGALNKHLLIDLVICEWKLVGGRASQLERRCREINRMTDDGSESNGGPRFIVIAMPKATNSAVETPSHSVSDEIQSCGFHDVIVKPVNIADLVKRVREIEGEIHHSRVKKIHQSHDQSLRESTTLVPTTASSTALFPTLTEPTAVTRSLQELQQKVTALQDMLESQNEKIQHIMRSFEEFSNGRKTLHEQTVMS